MTELIPLPPWQNPNIVSTLFVQYEVSINSNVSPVPPVYSNPPQ
jgi:hypothetical protein